MLIRNGSTSKWIQAQPAPLPSADACIAVLDEEIYLLGGHHRWLKDPMGMTVEPCACVMVWSPRANIWRAAPTMSAARSMTTTCAHQGQLYVFGGLASGWGEDAIASGEVYNPAAQRWSRLPSMPVPLHGAHAVSIEDKIYVLGGSFGSGPSRVDLIEVFDTKSRSWTVLKTVLPQRDCYPVAFEGKILCFGGNNEGDAYGDIHHAHKLAEEFMNKQKIVDPKKGKKKSKKKNKGGPAWRLPAASAVEAEAKEVWCLDVSTLVWTQLPDAPKKHYPEAGYFFRDGDVLRDAVSPDVNFNMATMEWEDDPGRAPLRNHKFAPQPVALAVPF